MLNRKILTVTLSALSLLGFSGLASATDINAQDINSQHVFPQIEAGSTYGYGTQYLNQASPDPFKSHEIEYTKTTYKDFRIKLFGPFKFGVSDEIIQHRFENLDGNYGNRVPKPNYSNHYDSSIYSRATAAKASWNIKF